jgi:hypothetical protein
VHELESGSTNSHSGERALAGLMDRVRDYDDDDDDESVIVMLIYLGHFTFLKLCARWCSF